MLSIKVLLGMLLIRVDDAALQVRNLVHARIRF